MVPLAEMSIFTIKQPAAVHRFVHRIAKFKELWYFVSNVLKVMSIIIYFLIFL